MARQIEQRQNRVEHYRAILRDKYIYNNSEREGGPSVKIAFKLSTTVTDHTYCFQTSDPIRVLYEYALAVGNLDCFSLYTTHPKKLLDITGVSLEQSGFVFPTAVFVEESQQDVVEILFPTADVSKVTDAELLPKELLEEFSAIRKKFVSTITKEGIGYFNIRRSNLYCDVINLFKEDLLKYSSLMITYEGEKAVDCGGVCRDMLSGFWEEAYKKLFDGSTLLTPVIHAQSNMQDFQLLGNVLSQGYFLEAFLPLRIAFPSLASMILDVEIPEDILVDSFIESLSLVECELLKHALRQTKFSLRITNKLIDLLSRFGSREVPTPSNLRTQLVQVARYQFVTRPMSAHTLIKSGISCNEKKFWISISITELHKLYKSLQGTPERVLEILEEPVFLNPAQERVYGYLRDMIGNFSIDNTRSFLRFVTGNSVLSFSPITVMFNGVSGLARCPVAHTCDSTLEISTSYSTYMEFANEFLSVLSSDCWSMDIL